MSLAAKVREILRQARASARPAEGPERPLPGATAPDRLASILAEVEETVLPRALTFAGGDGSRLTIEARGRRLARITAAEGGFAPAGWSDRLAAAEADAAAEARAMADLLAAFAEAAMSATVAAAPSELTASFVRPGHAVTALADAVRAAGGAVGTADRSPEAAAAAAPVPAGPSPSGLYDALSAAGEPAARAEPDGKVTRSVNDTGGVASSVAPAAASLATMADAFARGTLPGARLVFLAARDGAVPSVCLSTEGKDRIAGAPSDAARDAIAEAWRRGAPGGSAAAE
jgi:SWI/SNF-related matrix-associated actin-dependent regulator 1 of chromatin subfamily A